MTTIATGPPSVTTMLPCLTNISQVTSSLSHFQFHFLQSLSKCRNFLTVLQEDHKNQLQMTVDLCQRIDSLMNSHLSPKNQHMDSSQTAKIEVIQRSFSPVERLNSKEKPFNETDIKVKKQSRKIQNQVSVKEVNVIQKDTQSQKIQVYACLICLRYKKTPFIWGESQNYLDHIRQVHQIQPQFQILISGSKFLSFTHVFFQGQLIRLVPLEGQYKYENQLYFTVLYLLDKHRFNQLYVCGCLQINVSKSFRNGSPFLLSANDYANHVSHKHKNIEQAGSTHRLIVKNKYTRVMPVISSQNIFQSDKILELIQKIKARLQKYFSIIRYTQLLKETQHSKLLNLQIISTLPSHNKTQKYFHPIPYCPECKQYFNGIKEHLKHKLKIHQNKDNCQITQYGVAQMIDYLEHKGNKFDQQNSFTTIVTKQENRLLNLQMYLMSGRVKSCAECSLLFLEFNSQKFLLHLYQVHRGKFCEASHKFAFLKENLTSENYENLQEDQEISQ